MTWIESDHALVEEIASRLDLRAPNKAALSAIIEKIEVDNGVEVVCDLATGVGKTYLAAALVEYLAAQGVRNILIVTPGTTIQDKTVANFTPGSRKAVPGTESSPVLITAEHLRGQVGDALHDPRQLKLFVFNVQQLIRPSANTARKSREVNEYIGGALYAHLQRADDLVVIADEHHVYRTQAKAFSAAIRDLNPRALVGLTATPSSSDESKVIYRYSLAEAIADGLVKIPVIVYRRDGHKDIRTQLADACRLREIKAAAYETWAIGSGNKQVNPVLFVVCQSVADAREVSEILAGDGFIGDAGAVLEITSQSTDTALAALESVEDPDSPIRAVVSVDKLKEGWDVKNIGVIVALRRLASEALTEQILGRGLRLPYGRRVGVPMIDQVDLVAHDSYRKLLQQKDALIQRVVVPAGGDGGDAVIDVPVEFGEPGDDMSLTQLPEDDESGAQGYLELRTGARMVEGEGEAINESTLLILEEFGVAASEGKKDASEYRVLQRVPGAPQIIFPRREREVLPERFSFSLIDDADARAAGAVFQKEIKIPLIREALVARRTIAGDVHIDREAQEAADASQAWISIDQVCEDLRERIWNLGLVEETLPEHNAANRVVNAFLAGAGAKSSSEINWGAERASQATLGLAQLIKAKYNARRLQPQWGYRPVTIPVEPLPMPEHIVDRFADFQRGRWYKGWRQSILPVVSFDAKSTEYALAGIMDSATGISWWLRLQTDGPAYIELDDGGRYFPDFVAIDTDGVHWVIEGKSDNDVERADVQRKAAAGREWARFVTDEDRFGTWRYLFCPESAIKASHGSWDSLLIAAGAS